MRLGVLLLVALAACPSPGVSPDVGAAVLPDATAVAAPDAAPLLDAAAVFPDAAAPDAQVAGPDAAAPGMDAAAPGLDAATITDACDAGAGWCTGALSRHACVDTSLGRKWTDEACAAGSGCVAGACVVGQCSDECALGDSQGGRTCVLLDVASGGAVTADPAGSMHDRARAYLAWLLQNGLSVGGVGSPYYADPPTYSQIQYADGLGDSAIWTGTFLAAEALRLTVTGEPDARASVKARVATLHDWMRVSGDPGSLARFALPSDARPTWSLNDLTCQSPNCRECHCGVIYRSRKWDWLGHISRDQYQGVMLGYSLAYEALGPEDEPTRELIRSDVVTLVQELMRERSVAMKLTINGIPIATTIDLRFVVLTTSEMSGGALELTIDLSQPDQAEMWGFQEFTPDLSDIVRQVPGFSGVPSIPRASSAVMLAAAFRVALEVTDGVPARAADRAAILDYYLNHTGTGGNIDDWLGIARQWTWTDSCGGTYFGNNITLEPLYDLARLEDDPARQHVIRADLLRDTIWPPFASHKNCFFAFITAANVPGADPSIASAAAAQLGGFPVPPRIHHGIDLRGDARYQPQDPGCANQVNHQSAVDVADRQVEDFMWQRDPWTLYDAGDEHQVMPGVDYLVAYWMGRRHGFLQEDAGGRCLAWR